MTMLSNLKVYSLAVELYQACEGLKLRHHLQDQLLRASLSVVLNISEGAAKPSVKDRRRFYAIAYGSVRECQSILMLAKQDQEFQIADQVGACLYRLVYVTQTLQK